MKGMCNCVIALLLVVSAGCAGPMFEGTIFEQTRPPREREQETRRIVSQVQQQNDQAMQSLQDQIEALNMSLNRLEQRLARLEQIPRQDPGLEAMRADVRQLRAEVQKTRSEQGALRQEITTDIVSRVEKVAARQRAQQQAAVPVAPRPAPAEAASRSGYEHIVERGQTLTEIARGYGTTVRAVMRANKISNPSSIRVGQKLFIPDGER